MAKHTKSEPKSTENLNLQSVLYTTLFTITGREKKEHQKRTAHVCAYYSAQLPWAYITQRRTVLIIFPLILQTIVIVQTDVVYWTVKF